MPPAHRKGDTGSGHGCHFPSSSATGGSLDVLINGMPAMRVGDSFAAHGCKRCSKRAHGRALAEGSASVFINGMPAGRMGDAIDCGGAAADGSPNVFIGDEAIGAGATPCQADMAGDGSAVARD